MQGDIVTVAGEMARKRSADALGSSGDDDGFPAPSPFGRGPG